MKTEIAEEISYADISHVELVEDIDVLNKKLKEGYTLLKILIRRVTDEGGFFEEATYIVGQ